MNVFVEVLLSSPNQRSTKWGKKLGDALRIRRAVHEINLANCIPSSTTSPVDCSSIETHAMEPRVTKRERKLHLKYEKAAGSERHSLTSFPATSFDIASTALEYTLC